MESWSAWMVPADKHTVVFAYVNKESVRQAIQAIKQGKPGLAGDAGVAKTAALLPRGSVAALYVSPKGMIDMVKQILPAIAPPGANGRLKIPDFPKTPPIGFAVTAAWPGDAAANELHTCLVVPAEVLQAIGPYPGKNPGDAQRPRRRRQGRDA